MNLLDEIERISNSPTQAEIESGLAGQMWRLVNITPGYWHRIKAGLEAARQMDAEFAAFLMAYQSDKTITMSQKRFRKAMGE